MRRASQTNLPAGVSNARANPLPLALNGLQGQPFAACPFATSTTFQSGKT
jgi:hypothetical protein